MIVIGVGTGGTITGIAKRMKEKFGNKIQIIGVDPYGSLLATGNEQVYNYDVEGIGYDFIPEVLNRELIDDWVKINDQNFYSKRIWNTQIPIPHYYKLYRYMICRQSTTGYLNGVRLFIYSN